MFPSVQGPMGSEAIVAFIMTLAGESKELSR